MRSSSSAGQSWNGRRLKIAPITPAEQMQRIHDAIAQKALQICESRRFAPGHEQEDWGLAESETWAPLNCGYIVSDDKIELSTDVACFDEGEVEIRLEPRRMTICGRKREANPRRPPGESASSSSGNQLFRVLDLPFEIEPSQVTAKFKSRALEIDLPRARAKRAAVGKL